MKKIIDIGTLSISSQHIKQVVKALKSNRLSYGPMTAEFEQKFSFEISIKEVNRGVEKKCKK